MNGDSSVFKDSPAWFSSSVSEDLKGKWEQYGGRITDSLDDANYIFSSNPAAEDTRRAFINVRGSGLLMFKPKWIDYAIKVSTNSQLNALGIERFILLPEYVNEELKKIEMNAGNEKQEVEDDWQKFETELVHRLQSSSPQKVDKKSMKKKKTATFSDINTLQSTLLDTPVKNTLTEGTRADSDMLTCSTGRRKLRIRQNCFSGQSSLSPCSVKSDQHEGNCFVVIEDCSDKVQQLHNQLLQRCRDIDFKVNNSPRTRRKSIPEVKKSPTKGGKGQTSATSTNQKVLLQSNRTSPCESQPTDDSIEDLDGSFCALNTESCELNTESSHLENKTPKRTRGCISVQHAQEARTKSDRVTKNEHNLNGTERTPVRSNDKVQSFKAHAVDTCSSSQVKGTKGHSDKRPLPVSTAGLSENRTSKNLKSGEEKTCTSRMSQIARTEAETPPISKKRRKLYTQCEDDKLDSSSMADTSDTPRPKRKSVEEQLSPVDIHDILNSNGKEVLLSGKRPHLPCLKNVETTPVSSKKEVKKTPRVDIMQKHKEVIQLKKAGQKGVEEFQYGLFSGYTHIDDLEIPDMLLEDFIINNSGCRVELVRN